MSEGGQLPWKRQKHKSAPTADYQNLLRPLPNPPSGLTWVRGEGEHGREWYLVDTRDDVDSVVPAVGPCTEILENLADQVPVVILEQPDEKLKPKEANDFEEKTNATAIALKSIGTAAAATVLVEREQNRDNDLPGSTGDKDAKVPSMKNSTLPHATLVLEEKEERNPIHTMANTTSPSRSIDTTACVVASSSTHDSARSSDTARSCKAKEKRKEHAEKYHPKYGQYLVDYTEHVVLPNDTLVGLCLLYKISRRELQRANRFFGDSLQLAPSTLLVPLSDKAKRLGWQPQDTKSHDYQMAALAAHCPKLNASEVKCYLESNDWNLEKALEEALQDEEWERHNEAAIAQKKERDEQIHQRADEQSASLLRSSFLALQCENAADDVKDEGDQGDCCDFLLREILSLTGTRGGRSRDAFAVEEE